MEGQGGGRGRKKLEGRGGYGVRGSVVCIRAKRRKHLGPPPLFFAHTEFVTQEVIWPILLPFAKNRVLWPPAAAPYRFCEAFTTLELLRGADVTKSAELSGRDKALRRSSCRATVTCSASAIYVGIIHPESKLSSGDYQPIGNKYG